MSYQLAFWRGNTPDAAATYEKLVEGHDVLSVDPVEPNAVLASCRETFDDWSVQDNLWTFQPDADGNGPGFDLEVGQHLITFTCYGLEDEQMNGIIGAMNHLGYPLYDPQTGERFRVH